jgi:hypothetical protein
MYLTEAKTKEYLIFDIIVKGKDRTYIKLAPFTLKDISESILANTRVKKEDKYKPIID